MFQKALKNHHLTSIWLTHCVIPLLHKIEQKWKQREREKNREKREKDGSISNSRKWNEMLSFVIGSLLWTENKMKLTKKLVDYDLVLNKAMLD